MKRRIAFLLVILLAATGWPAAQGSTSAVITVNTVADDLTNNGNCTLREAIEAANSDTAVDGCPAGTASQPDTITFATNGIFALSQANGVLFIGSPLIIEGNGRNLTILDGMSAHSIFYIAGSGTVALRHLTLQNGYAEKAKLSPGLGGAIFTVATDLILEDVLIQDNTVVSLGGGGIFVGGGSLSLIDSTIRNNSANGTDYGGGGVLVSDAILTIQDSVVSENTADSAFGGGLVVQSSILTMTHSLVDSNTAVSGLGGGGGFYIQDSRATIEYSTIQNNQASESTQGGGGLLIDNKANIYLLITSSTIQGNSANLSPAGGGGLHVIDGNVELWNSTLSGNTADESGQGGGGMLGGMGTLSYIALIYATVAYNHAYNADGGGINPQNEEAALTHTIVAGNLPSDCHPGSLMASAGYNLDGDNSCSLDGPGDLPATDPLLGSLQNNGGPTETHALPENSPALDGGNCWGDVTTDQRGMARPYGLTCDIGSFEFRRSIWYLPVVVNG
jgi:CSLREA domain-containing protein